MDRDLTGWKIVACDHSPTSEPTPTGDKPSWLVAVGDEGRGRLIDENLGIAYPENWLSGNGTGWHEYSGPQDILGSILDRVKVCDTDIEMAEHFAQLERDDS